MLARGKFSERVRVVKTTSGGRTQQHFKDEVDINNILSKYRKTGVITHVKRAQAKFGDFSEMAEYGVNVDKAQKAQAAFESLPAELRGKFKNSIAGFFEFIMQEKNFDECVKMGIYEAPKPPPGGAAVSEPAVPAGSTKKGAPKAAPKISEPQGEE